MYATFFYEKIYHCFWSIEFHFVAKYFLYFVFFNFKIKQMYLYGIMMFGKSSSVTLGLWCFVVSCSTNRVLFPSVGSVTMSRMKYCRAACSPRIVYCWELPIVFNVCIKKKLVYGLGMAVSRIQGIVCVCEGGQVSFIHLSFHQFLSQLLIIFLFNKNVPFISCTT